MKLANENLNVEKSGNIVEYGFRIKTTAKAFKILSDGLYSDKKKAIIRELSTNAFDAHVMAGKKDVPFQVHLPNALEPWLAIKDWGTGLSDEDINSIYTTYFESNKTNNNDVTGCLGLGSKSPFCYVDSFTVSSRFDKIERVYNAFINEHGIPSIAKIAEFATDEQNGLEVKVNVKEEDFWEFENTARDVLSWFDPQPNVVGSGDFEFISREYHIQKKEYGICKGSSSHVVMGNVAYPFSYDNICPNNRYVASPERDIVNHGVHLFMNIGDVEMSASRESLQFNNLTNQNILKTIKVVVDDLKTEVEQQLQSATDIWSARRKLWEFSQNSPLMRLAGIKTFVWNGIVVETTGINYKKYLPYAPVVNLLTFEKSSYRRRRSSNSSSNTLRRLDADTIFADGTEIFSNDVGRGAFVMAEDYMLKNNVKKAYMIGESPEELQTDGPILSKFLKDNGIEDIVIPVSTLPKRERQARGKGVSRDYAAVMLLNPVCSNEPSFNWTNTKIDIKNEKKVYVEIAYYKWIVRTGGNGVHPQYLHYIKSALDGFGAKVEIYGVKSAEIERVKKNGWIPLDSYIRDFFGKNKSLHLALDKYNCLKNNNLRDYCKYENMKFSDTSIFGNFVKKVVAWYKEIDVYGENNLKNFKNITNFYPEFDSSSGKDFDSNEINDMHVHVYANYALLGNIYSHHKSDLSAAIHEYVTLLDEKRCLPV